MLLGRDGLRVRWHDKMDSPHEYSLLWKLGQGCVGAACRRGEIVAEDLPAVSAFEQLRGEDDQTDWGLTLDHWLATRDLRSVLCIPLRSPRRTKLLLGALCIDARLPLAESRIGENDLVVRSYDLYAPLIAHYLVQCGFRGGEP